MANRIWIKLFIEILDDPKMGRLPNHLWRRAVELFLLAGRKGNDGALPPVEEMVWIIRLSADKLLDDLHDLAEAGVVHEAEPKKWVVTNFAKRQAAIPAVERMRRSRIRDDPVTVRNSSCYDNVTNRNKTCYESGGGDSSSTSTSSSGSESLEEEGVQGEGPKSPGAGKPADIFRAYEQNIGAITPMIAEALQDAEKSDGPDWIIAAIEEAVKNNARSWKYIESILRRWRRDGFQVDTKPESPTSRQRNDGKLTPEQLAAWVEDRQKVEA